MAGWTCSIRCLGTAATTDSPRSRRPRPCPRPWSFLMAAGHRRRYRQRTWSTACSRAWPAWIQRRITISISTDRRILALLRPRQPRRPPATPTTTAIQHPVVSARGHSRSLAALHSPGMATDLAAAAVCTMLGTLSRQTSTGTSRARPAFSQQPEQEQDRNSHSSSSHPWTVLQEPH